MQLTNEYEGYTYRHHIWGYSHTWDSGLYAVKTSGTSEDE